jgi:Glu-tRNA(Gln) amidotransferase subunit E-like FAD-binding protein
MKKEQERTISKEAYEDFLNMQRCSNAGYQSKITELENKIKQMFSEEEVKHIIEKTLIEYSDYVLADIPKWFEKFKKK